jgi:arylsulfatase A-like enzyme
LKRWFALVLNAPVIGVVYLIALYAYAIREPLVPANQILLGKDAKDISDYVGVRFRGEILEIAFNLGLAAAGIGLALGVVALGILTVRNTMHPRRRKLRWTALESLGLVIWLHLACLFASMARWPQLYTSIFWSEGGIRAWLERTAVDRLGLTGVVAIALIGIVAFVRPRFRRMSPRRLVIGSGCFLVAALVLWRVDAMPTRDIPIPAKRAKGPSIIILAADGLRADCVRPEIAPRLSAEAARGTTFDHAYVNIGRTLDSWTSILTGLYPHHHGLRSAFVRWEDTEKKQPALPQVLDGYVTAAISDYAGDVFGQAPYGFSYLHVPPSPFPTFLTQLAIERSTPLLPFLQTRRGHELFPAIDKWAGAADPEFVADEAVATLRAIGDHPYFMVVFFSTTHFPYAAPAPYHAKFTKPDYDGPYRYEKQVTANVPILPNAADVEQVRGLYKGAVAAVDAAAGRILDAVDPNTVVVITADHGESLFEDNRWHGHGNHLFGDEGLHVPLSIHDPRSAKPHVEHALVREIDVAPTLAELAGVELPGKPDGRSLAPAIRGEAIESQPVFAESGLLLGDVPGFADELHYPATQLFKLLEVDTEHDYRIAIKKEMVLPTLMSRQRMIRDEHHKLIYMPSPTGVRYRLYDLDKDPDEQRDVFAEQPEVAKALGAELWSWMLEDPLMKREGDYLWPKALPPPKPLE